MAHRLGLDRFKKAQSTEPFNINTMGIKPPQPQISSFQPPARPLNPVSLPGALPTSSAIVSDGAPKFQTTSVGGGNSTWQPPDWAADPRPGVYTLEIQKDGNVVDTIMLEKKRTIFGRQAATCDFVLDHPSLSRQHAAVVHHKNGRVFVIDMGSVHGTFVSNERVAKDSPTELEPGQSLRFAASTRVYILRKAESRASLFMPERPLPIQLPPPPDGNDPESVVAYNTMLNRLGVGSSLDEGHNSRTGGSVGGVEGTSRKRKSFSETGEASSRASGSSRSSAKKAKNVTFRDHCGGELATVVGFSDGADISTEPGPMGVQEGSSLKGKFDMLVQTTLIPKKQQDPAKAKLLNSAEPAKGNSAGVTDNFKEYLNRVRSPGGKGGLYGGLLGEASPAFTGGTWGGASQPVQGSKDGKAETKLPIQGSMGLSSSGAAVKSAGGGDKGDDQDDDDLFGDGSTKSNVSDLRGGSNSMRH